MRKFVQKQILEILETVGEGVKYAKNSPATGANVLNDCISGGQWTAEILREQLDASSFGPYAPSFMRLAEALQNALAELEKGKAFPPDDYNELRKILRHITRLLEKDENIRLEVVFFPYKASMWDSMESIWLAAKKDSRCDVYVVPVPYYDRNADLSFGRLNYDGELFPPEAGIIPFGRYDYKSRRPDIAYIHNPYDDRNYVSSIHPDYYSNELKGSVDKLVYVPYYVNKNISGDNFLAVTAACGADVIISPSKAEKKELDKLGSGKQTLALGSPKLDRIFALDKEKSPIPENWKKALEGKKIFLLNTSVSGLLTYSDVLLEKLEYIFSVFKSHDEAALLWRPHPLSEMTMKSMRPDLLKEYNVMVERYKKEKIGVYDDTWDVERAIALADAYIGEQTSSLVYMFAVTGKPLHILDYSVSDKPQKNMVEDYARRQFSVIPFIKDGKAYFVDIESNRAMETSLENGKSKVLFEIKEEHAQELNLYYGGAACGDELFFTPNMANGFVRAKALANGEFAYSYTKIPDRWYSPEQSSFTGSYAYKSKVFFIPSGSNAIACMDTKTGKVKYYDAWHKELQKHDNGAAAAPYFGKGCTQDNLLFLPMFKSNLILIFNMENANHRFSRVGEGSGGFNCIRIHKGHLWFTKYREYGAGINEADSIIRIHVENNNVDEFRNFPEGFKLTPSGTAKWEENTAFSFFIPFGDSLLAFPFRGNMIVEINAESGEMRRFNPGLDFDFSQRKYSKHSLGPHFAFVGQEKYKAYVLAYYDMSILEIDIVSGETRRIRFLQPEDRVISPSQRSHKGYYHRDTPLYRAESYVNDVLNGSIAAYNNEQAASERAYTENADGSSGEKIHRAVADMLL